MYINFKSLGENYYHVPYGSFYLKTNEDLIQVALIEQTQWINIDKCEYESIKKQIKAVEAFKLRKFGG